MNIKVIPNHSAGYDLVVPVKDKEKQLACCMCTGYPEPAFVVAHETREGLCVYHKQQNDEARMR